MSPQKVFFIMAGILAAVLAILYLARHPFPREEASMSDRRYLHDLAIGSSLINSSLGINYEVRDKGGEEATR